MANIFQRAWNDVTGWLNTPQGRTLNPELRPINEPTYFQKPGTMAQPGDVPIEQVPAVRQPAPARTPAPTPPAVPYFPETGRTYFPAHQVVGGQPMPARDMVWNPNAPSPIQPLRGGTVWNPNAPSPRGLQWDYSTGQETPPPTNIDPLQFARGNTPQGGGPSMTPGPTTPNVPATPPPQPVIRPSGSTTGLGGFGAQAIQDVATGPAPGVSPGGADMNALYKQYSGQPVSATQPQSQPLGPNQGFEGEYSSGISAPVEQETKVTHADGSSTHVKHTTAQAAAQKQAGRQQQAGGGQPAQGGGQPAQSGGQRGGMAGLGTGAYNAPAGSTAPTVGSTMGQVPQQGGGLGGPSGPQGAMGPTATVQVPAHPGLLQRIGQTIGHFFSGTLGQWAPQQGQTINLGTLPNQTQGNALSGVHNALAQGQHHIVSNRGGTAPASAPPPPFPYQTNPEIGTWGAAGGLPPYGTTTFPYDPGLLRAGGTMPPPSQFNLASGYQ
jgi:hypothetical protein